MLAFCLATKPLLVAMKWSAKSILRIWGIEAADAVKTVYTADELANLVTQARTEGLLDAEEHARIRGALALQSRTASDAMRPWHDVDTVPPEASPARLEVMATTTGRSRFPVVRPGSRQVVGFVHVKDVLGITGPARREPVSPDLVRPLSAVPPERSLADLLLAMRRERRHIVLVSDGRVPLGVVTLHDVLRVIAALPV
jgi:CBS domain containing-hemolysin-like protein